jgi:hypothetical protein
MPRRIAQERVPAASNVGSRDVTWTSQSAPLIPFRVFSRVSRAPFHRLSADTYWATENPEGQVKYCHCTFSGHATPDRAGVRPECVPTTSNIGSRDVTWTSQSAPLIPSHPLSRLSRAPFHRLSGDTYWATGGRMLELQNSG